MNSSLFISSCLVIFVTLISDSECQDRLGCVCTREYNPVCGNNGRTYANPCVFRCAQRRNPNLRIAHTGECRGDGSECDCSRELNPICGTDGRTYANPCIFRCAQRSRPDLELDHWGPC